MADAAPPNFTGPPDPLDANYMLRTMRSVAVALEHPAILAANIWADVERDIAKEGGINNAILKVFKDLGSDPNQIASLLTGGAYGTIAWVLTFITGLSFSSPQLQTMIAGTTDAEKRNALGQILTDLYAETLKTDKPAAGWLARNPGDAELDNFRQLSGAAMRLSLSEILINWAAEALPLGLAEGLRDIAEKINDAVALDDALEEVVQVPMQAVIQRGLEAKYNRELKPADLSANEALQALISGKIDQATLDKILDNAGYRDDIRQILRDFAATNLTESDINDCYQWNLFDRAEVKKQYKAKYFEDDDAEIKTKLVEMTRRQKLRERVFELYGNLYRDGVATKQEVTPFLESYGYDADEVEMWFQVQELERRQRKWISDANVLKLVMQGKWSFDQAIQYEVLQGQDVNDAIALMSLAVKEEKGAEVKEVEREAKATIAKLPKAIRDKCDDLLKPEDLLAELLSRLTALIPGDLNLIPGALKLKSYIECAIKAIVTPGP